MDYRELQAELKKHGLKASGKKAVLEAKLEAFLAAKGDGAPVAEQASSGKGFVFVGDTMKTHTKWKSPDIVQQHPDNPPTLTIKGYTFVRDGEAVEVDDELAAKLRTHSHFKEV